jgi:hypothetical protein
MEIKMSDAVKEVMGKRGIKQADVEDVVKSAVSSGKMFSLKGENRHLACKKVGDLTVYADFELESGILKKTATVKSAYSHRIKLNKVDSFGEVTNWMMGTTPVHQATIQMEYLNVVRSGPGLTTPDGATMMVEEYLATKTLAAAEGLRFQSPLKVQDAAQAIGQERSCRSLHERCRDPFKMGAAWYSCAVPL